MLRQEPPLVATEPVASRLLVALLRGASRVLDAAAVKLSSTSKRERLAEPVIEFHAEAGAPEGALYVDGRLIGHVVGVKRL